MDSAVVYMYKTENEKQTSRQIDRGRERIEAENRTLLLITEIIK